ncbi:MULTISPECIES: helix-turn-helix domain-containing protein [Alphaproteobacteria]|uniref:AraC family transcriptional regulator n=2 Tax=Alphaproteobacteria TaxID=28211 RepID=A0A512HJG1_9HYPH|nr:MULTISPECIES: helix-turn-helix domain-containing protein [Alphaproteobacteria]GEO85571.1 AraC family transcriptional regulator [Ciceribacter naphthalenivorans]GLR22074.1 AraC family transcriptional regulator [Ciceribacter naphthalenivorans]GLT04930.1 AraC family transcriptional regulator [Sphingomonas psychrolutea]
MPRAVPIYSLYGEKPTEHTEFWAHAETIFSRSSLHSWEIRPHRHERLFQILHIRSGHGEALIDGHWHPFGARTVIVMPERQDHGFRFSRDVDGAVITLVAKRFAAELQGHSGLGEWLRRPSMTPMPDDHPDSRYLGESLDRAEQAIVQSGARPAPLVEPLLRTVLLLTSRLAGAERGQGETDRDRERLAELTRMIGENFRTRLPVEHYARRLGMSATHLNRITRALVGKPVSRLIAERIILEAKRDLVFSALSVQQVATRLGFEDQAYFSRFFAQNAGMPPKLYREREKALLES